MSIWNDCEELDALPYYGYPIKVTVDKRFITFDFPKGYGGYGGTEEFKKNAEKKYGTCILCTDKKVVVEIDFAKMERVIYNSLFVRD